jgi:hypothetical protein
VFLIVIWHPSLISVHRNPLHSDLLWVRSSNMRVRLSNWSWSEAKFQQLTSHASKRFACTTRTVRQRPTKRLVCLYYGLKYLILPQARISWERRIRSRRTNHRRNQWAWDTKRHTQRKWANWGFPGLLHHSLALIGTDWHSQFLGGEQHRQ